MIALMDIINKVMNASNAILHALHAHLLINAHHALQVIYLMALAHAVQNALQTV